MAVIVIQTLDSSLIVSSKDPAVLYVSSENSRLTASRHAVGQVGPGSRCKLKVGFLIFEWYKGVQDSNLVPS